MKKAYREDWEYDKSCIYYPVHITPGYEQALEVSKFQSDVSCLMNDIFCWYIDMRNSLSMLMLVCYV